MVTLEEKYGYKTLKKAYKFLDKSPICEWGYPNAVLIIWYLEYFYKTPEDLEILKLFP